MVYYLIMKMAQNTKVGSKGLMNMVSQVGLKLSITLFHPELEK